MATLFTLTGGFIWLVIGLMIAGKILRVQKEKARISVSDKTVVITGCDSGLGQGVMKRLIAQNAHVIALTYTEEGAAQAKTDGAAHVIQCDLSNKTHQQKAIAEILEASSGNVWGLVHCAGLVLPGFVEYQPDHFYEKTMALNFHAIVNLTQPLISSIKKNQGRITVVSSVDGIVSLPGNAPYDASKFAVEGYADALRMELSFWNVHVSVVNPATMKTPLAMSFFEAHRHTWKTFQQENPEGDWQTDYSEAWLNQFVDSNTPQLERIAQDPDITINDLEHSMTAKHPKHRYLSGRLAKTFFRALWWMPERWATVIKIKTINPIPKKS